MLCDIVVIVTYFEQILSHIFGLHHLDMTSAYLRSICVMDADVKSVDTVWFVKVVNEINATEDIVTVT